MSLEYGQNVLIVEIPFVESCTMENSHENFINYFVQLKTPLMKNIGFYPMARRLSNDTYI